VPERGLDLFGRFRELDRHADEPARLSDASDEEEIPDDGDGLDGASPA